MKRIYVIVFAAALSTSLFSCEPAPDKIEQKKIDAVGDSIKSKTEKTIENESDKTTKNGSDAH